MDAVARFHPFAHDGLLSFSWAPGDSLLAIVRKAIAVMETASGQSYQWFLSHGIARVNGRAYVRDMWAHIKPRAGTFVDFIPDVRGGKVGKIGLVLAAVALTVGTVFVAGGGLAPFLGAAFAKGTFGALAASALLGVAGNLALNALTPAPALPESPERRERKAAGVAANAITPGEVLYALIGRRRVTPQMIIPPFVEFDGDRFWANALVGLHGPCAVSDIQIDGTAIEEISGATWEVREGVTDLEPDTFLSHRTVKTSPFSSSATLKNTDLQKETGTKVLLKDQDNPEKSLPEWQQFKVDPGASAFLLRFQAPGGIGKGDPDNPHGLPLRIEMRAAGSATWRRLPTLYADGGKKLGEWVADVTIRWQDWPTEPWFGGRAEYPIYHSMWNTGMGQAFAYQSDPYFEPVQPLRIPPLTITSNTSESPYVFSASHNSGDAWKGFRNNVWAPPTSTPFGAWLQVDCGALKTLYGWGIGGSASAAYARIITVSGSDDGSSFTDIVTYERTVNAGVEYFNFPRAARYRYFRFTFLDNFGAANNDVQVSLLALFDRPFTSLGPGTGHESYNPPGVGYGSFSTPPPANAAFFTHCHAAGCDIMLDPGDWPADGFDVRVKRGTAYLLSDFVTFTGAADVYRYNGNALYACFFDYYIDGIDKKVYLAQDNIQSSLTVTQTQTYFEARPIRADIEQQLCRIAVRIPDRQITSISALMTAKARVFAGGVWGPDMVPTRNPVAFLRDALLLKSRNALPLPGEVVEDSNLEQAFPYAATHDLTCDALVQGRSISDVLFLCAAALRASPRRADWWGLVVDRDRTGEPPLLLLTPENSRNLGVRLPYPKIPHAMRVTYLDRADEDKPHDVVVYAPGYSAETATLYEGVTDNAADTAAKAVATATYNFDQMLHRRETYRYEVGIEGHWLARGDLVAIADEVLLRYAHYGLVREVMVSGGMVTGFRLYGPARLSSAQGQFTAQGDVAGLGDVDAPVSFRAMVQAVGGLVVSFSITETGDTDVVTLATPVAFTGQFIEDRLIAIGPTGLEHIRAIIKAKRQSGRDRFELELVREAPEILRPA